MSGNETYEGPDTSGESKGTRLGEALRSLKARISREPLPASQPKVPESAPKTPPAVSEIIPSDAARGLDRSLSLALEKTPEDTATEIRARLAKEIASRKILIEKGSRTQEQIDRSLLTTSILFEAITRGKSTALGVRAASDPQMRAEGGYHPPSEVADGVDVFYSSLGVRRPDIRQAQQNRDGENTTVSTETSLGNIVESLSVKTPTKLEYSQLGVNPVTNGNDYNIPAELHTIHTYPPRD